MPVQLLRRDWNLARLGLITVVSIVLLQGCTVLSGALAAKRHQPWVIVVSGGVGLSALFRDCVMHYQGQGLSINQAVGQCLAVGVMRQAGGGGSGLNAGFVAGSGSGGVAIQCSTLSTDPRASGMVHRPPDGTAPPLTMDDWLTRDKLYESYMQLKEILMMEAAADLERLREERKNSTSKRDRQILDQQIKQTEAYIGALFDESTDDWYRHTMQDYYAWKEDHPASEPGDYPLPDPDAPQPANVNPESVSACQNLADFVNECRRSDWKTSPCQMFLDKLDGCGDPRVTDPSPDEERPCKSQRVSKEEARRVAYLVCSKTTKPGPDSNPCSGGVAVGMAYEFTYGKQNPNLPICSNPFALTTAEACTSTFTVISGTQQGFEGVIAEANRRLGGPIFVVPAPSPVDPKSGGGCAGDPRCLR